VTGGISLSRGRLVDARNLIRVVLGEPSLRNSGRADRIDRPLLAPATLTQMQVKHSGGS
jgi:hypothetical protein